MWYGIAIERILPRVHPLVSTVIALSLLTFQSSCMLLYIWIESINPKRAYISSRLCVYICVVSVRRSLSETYEVCVRSGFGFISGQCERSPQRSSCAITSNHTYMSMQHMAGKLFSDIAIVGQKVRAVKIQPAQKKSSFSLFFLLLFRSLSFFSPPYFALAKQSRAFSFTAFEPLVYNLLRSFLS